MSSHKILEDDTKYAYLKSFWFKGNNRDSVHLKYFDGYEFFKILYYIVGNVMRLGSVKLPSWTCGYKGERSQWKMTQNNMFDDQLGVGGPTKMKNWERNECIIFEH